MDDGQVSQPERALGYVLIVAAAGGLHAVSRSNYLLFHGIVENLNLVVALSIFVLAWVARKYLENAYLLVLGVAHLFLGVLGLLHGLAFPGMSVFATPGYPANQLWIAARWMEGLTFVVAFAFLPVRKRPNPFALLASYGAVTAAIIASIFGWRNFPVCFVEGVGQTPFKVASELLVIGLLLASLVLLHANRERFDPRVRRAIAGSLLATIAAGICFSLYARPVGPFNLLGHLFRLVAGVMIYTALVKTCMDRPFDLVFRELNLTNARLSREMEARRETERAKEMAMRGLQAATDEIRTLRGILPICSHCKQIRDDRGAWTQLEAYIQGHSEAQFSHGLCPDCVRRWYPDQVDAMTPAPGHEPR